MLPFLWEPAYWCVRKSCLGNYVCGRPFWNNDVFNVVAKGSVLALTLLHAKRSGVPLSNKSSMLLSASALVYTGTAALNLLGDPNDAIKFIKKTAMTVGCCAMLFVAYNIGGFLGIACALAALAYLFGRFVKFFDLSKYTLMGSHPGLGPMPSQNKASCLLVRWACIMLLVWYIFNSERFKKSSIGFLLENLFNYSLSNYSDLKSKNLI